MSQGSLNLTQLCSDCWLGGLALKLSSPLGYDPDIESSFTSLTSSCNATKYSFTSPAAYALNATETSVPATVTATPAPSCTGSYTVQAIDDCNSAARSLNVSTYSLLSANNLDLYCVNFAAAVGTNLCIPPKCSTYTWQALDTCEDIVAGLEGITLTQFLAWNPNFNSLCLNSINFVGYEVCIRYACPVYLIMLVFILTYISS
jgi:LysM domain